MKLFKGILFYRTLILMKKVYKMTLKITYVESIWIELNTSIALIIKQSSVENVLRITILKKNAL